jgi:hypothetical protein
VAAGVSQATVGATSRFAKFVLPVARRAPRGSKNFQPEVSVARVGSIEVRPIREMEL